MDPAISRATVGRAAALLATDPASAEREVRRVLLTAPRDPGANLILGSALRRQGKAAAAVKVLEPLVRAMPRAALAQFEFGMTLADLGRATEARVALKASTSLDRENPDAWRALGALLFEAGDARGAEAAFAEHQRALVRDLRLKPAAEALHRGRPDAAEALLRPILSAAPQDAAALALLAEALSRQSRSGEAAAILAQLLARSPNDDQLRFRLARALLHQQKGAEALAELERLVADEPTNAAYRNLMASTLALLGEFDRSLAVYETMVAAHPRQPQIWINYGQALRAVGRATEAAAAFRRAIDADPAGAESYLALANLKLAALNDSDVAAMRALAAQPDLPAERREQLDFALGQALEDRGDYAGAFASYAAGAARAGARAPYSAEAFTEEIRRSIALFTPAFFAERTGWGAATPDPIFIVGLPRSGSTLIEQILASHPQVEGTSELPDIGYLAASPGRYPDGVARLTAVEAKRLGESYLASTRAQRKSDRPFFIDKMPNNFQFVGLIQLILPNARIVDARRHPLATCVSAFRQHFAQGQAFSYDLADLGRYYRDYLDLMAHVDGVLPGRVRRVIYEDLVEDTEVQVRALLAALGLPFDPACLGFHQTRRAVRTPSSEQVRRPIFREGLEQWRNFDPWLGPLKQALGPALERWRG